MSYAKVVGIKDYPKKLEYYSQRKELTLRWEDTQRMIEHVLLQKVA